MIRGTDIEIRRRHVEMVIRQKSRMMKDYEVDLWQYYNPIPMSERRSMLKEMGISMERDDFSEMIPKMR